MKLYAIAILSALIPSAFAAAAVPCAQEAVMAACVRAESMALGGNPNICPQGYHVLGSSIAKKSGQLTVTVVPNDDPEQIFYYHVKFSNKDSCTHPIVR